MLVLVWNIALSEVLLISHRKIKKTGDNEDSVVVKWRSTNTSWLIGVLCKNFLASSPGHYQILFLSHGEKSGEGLGAILRHGPEMVDSVS